MFRVSYGYDALDRLEEERKAGPPEERQIYEYDLNGNRLREREKQEIEHFLEKGSNRLLATEELLRTGEGEVEESSTSWRYEYNNAGRLKAVYQEGVKVSTYLYGADGLRRKKTVYETDGSTVAKEIHYHYVSGLLVSETTATGTLLRDYLWNPDGSPLAQIEGSTPGNSQERLLYLHADHLLTPRRATNTAGTSVWSWESSAFGKESPKQDPDGDATLTVVQLRYPGQYHDAETGLYYNYFRYYDPGTGRYVQSDLIGLQGGLNTYVYVTGNPLRYKDPYGLDCVFSISKGTMRCSDSQRNEYRSSGWIAGQGGWCQNNPRPECIFWEDIGPPPTGIYTITGIPLGRKKSSKRRAMKPGPGTEMGGRCCIQTHGCPDTEICSKGCIAHPDKEELKRWNKWVDSHPNETITVIP